jgi:TetR/AcrR family transcriptional regulator, transcriptional repressor for nem operon
MARPRTFDEEAVLDAVRDLFWARGFQATSLDDVTRATGVNKPSLYAAFGDKAALFALILARYHTAVLQLNKRMLDEPGSAREAVRGWLKGFLPFCSEQAGARGCLSINATLEASVLSPEIAAMVKEFQANLEAQLRATLERGKAEGEFAPSFDAAAAARALLVAQSGLLVLARSQPSAKMTAAAMDSLLSSMLSDVTTPVG